MLQPARCRRQVSVADPRDVVASARPARLAGVPVWATVAIGLGAGVAGALVTAVIGAWSLVQRDQRADKRALRDRKLERLRVAFRPVLYTATMWADIVLEQKVVWSGDTVARRDERLSQQLRKAQEGIDDAQLALELEPLVGQGILDRFRSAREAYTAYRIDVGMREQARQLRTGAPVPKLAELDEKEQALRRAVEELRTAMQTAIAVLEQPV